MESQTDNEFDGKHIFLIDYSGIISFLLYAIAFVFAFLTWYFPISQNSRAFEIYSRNISTIVAVYLLGRFFIQYYTLHTGFDFMSTKKSLKVISILLASASAVKIILSAYFAYAYLLQAGNMVGLYYVGEIVIWAAVGVFAIAYCKRLH